MSKTIVIPFDERSALWTKDRGFNSHVLKTQEQYINDLIGRRGYIYLNQIYEMLGVEWDPECENVCVKKQGERAIYVDFAVFPYSDGSILVHIYHI